MAKWLMHRQPVRVGVLYRGVLVEPHQLDRHWLPHDEKLKFVSYSQELEVACWYADPASIISGDVVARRPAVRGYIIAGKGNRDRLLWHHDWLAVDLPDGGQRLSLPGAAEVHPEIDAAQFTWNARTQSEVIEAAPSRADAKFHVEPVADRDCPDVEDLDARYTFPPFLTERYGG